MTAPDTQHGEQQAGHHLPLAAHVLFQTRDLDEARERVAAVFCPHRLDRIGRGGFHARHHHLRGERLSLNYIDYGAKTLIAPGLLQDFYLLQMPLSGAASIRNGGQDYVSDSGRAAVLNPHLPTTMIWDQDCRQVLIQIERAALEAQLARHLGRRPAGTLTFSGALDLTGRRGAALRGLVLHVLAEADAGRSPLGPASLLGRQIESALLTGLLEAHGHSQSEAMAGRGGGDLAPRIVRRAEEFMLAHPDQPLAIEDVAAAAGVGARALQLAFRRFRDMTPMEFLRRARLERAHADLQAARPGTTVTEIATRWGFAHFGRFAQSYRACYGQSPSQTLQEARAGYFVN